MTILPICLALTGVSCEDRSDPRQVVLYCSVDQEVAEPVIAHFEELTGIKVLARYDTEASKTVGLVQRIRAEAASPAADVFWSGEVFHTIRLAREGLLEPYGGAGILAMNHRQDADATESRGQDARDRQGREGFPNAIDRVWGPDALATQSQDGFASFADPNGCWHGFALRARVIGYNTDRVSTAEAPRSLEDVLSPKWKGRLVMASPAFGTTGGDVASWFAHYGPERARQILQALKANDVRLVSGNSTAVRMIATGQADLCFTDTDDIYAGQRNGWPVAMNFLDQGGDGVLAIPNTVALIKGGHHPENARLLMRFLLSGELEDILAASDSHNSPLHVDVAQRYPQYAIPQPLAIDYGRVADFLPEAIGTAREILE